MPLVATVMLENRQPQIRDESGPIQADDVIEAHKFLKDFNGSFQEIFSTQSNLPPK